MTWHNPNPTATNPADRASRLTCDTRRPRYTATLRKSGTMACPAAVVGFPGSIAAREAARDAGWRTATDGRGTDRCPTHRDGRALRI